MLLRWRKTMIDALLDIFSDIVDFFADLWLNKISAKYHQKKEAEKKAAETEEENS